MQRKIQLVLLATFLFSEFNKVAKKDFLIQILARLGKKLVISVLLRDFSN